VKILEHSAASSEAEVTTASSVASHEELIIKEARRRQRRRWLGVGISALVAAVVVLVFAFPSGHAPSKPRPRIARTSRPPAAAAVPRCAPSDLSVDVGFVQGTSESWLIPLTFTNSSAESCSVAGYPKVSLVNKTGQSVGLAPTEEQVQGGASDRPIVLARSESVTAELWQPETTILTANTEACSPVSWSAVRITSPAVVVTAGASGAWSQATTTCTTGKAAAWVTPFQWQSPPG